MRNFNEARSEYTQYLDKRADWGEREAIGYGRRKGYTAVGVCGTAKAHGIVLFPLFHHDTNYIKGSNVKSGETVFRYATRNSMAGDIFPLVKINAKKGLLYNLTQASSEGEIETAQFETKSSKLKYLRILASASKVDGFDNYVTEQLDEAKQTPFQIMQDIVKNSQAKKIEGKMVDTFTASAITQAYAKVNDKNKKRIETSNLSTLVNLAGKIMGGGSKNEAVEMNEGMSDAMFTDLKKGDRLQIKFDSPMAKGGSGSFVVSFKSKSKKYNLEKVTLTKDKKGPGMKYYLYNRNGKVTMAAGDMAVSLTNVVKESMENEEIVEAKGKMNFAQIRDKRKKKQDKEKWTKKDHDYLQKNTSDNEKEWDGKYESVEYIDEAVTVKKQKYSYGNVVTIAKDNSYSVILHDKEHKLVGKLEDGEKFSFSDDTGETWMAERKKKNLVFVGVRKKIIVPADKVISESVSEAFKVGDKVSVSKGPHKGQKHEIIHVKPGGGYNVKPVGLMARDIKYKLGAAGAKASDVSVWKGFFESVDQIDEARPASNAKNYVRKGGNKEQFKWKVTLNNRKTKTVWADSRNRVKDSLSSEQLIIGIKSAKKIEESVEQIDELTDKQKAEIAKRKAMRVGQAAKKKEKTAAKKADAEQKKKDNPNARGEYLDAADKGLIMQLRSAEDISNEKEHPITFRRGKTEKVPHEDVKAVLSFHDALKKPDDKRRLKIQLAKGGATAAKKLADVYRKTSGK